MINRDIRAYLRGGVVARLVAGWQQIDHPQFGTYFTISPQDGGSQRYSPHDAGIYCEMLRDSGVERL